MGDDDMIFASRFPEFSISVHGDPNVQDMCSRFRLRPVASKEWSQKAKLVRHTCSRTPGEPPSWRKQPHESNTPDPRTMRTRTNIKNRNEATGTGTVLRFVCITSVRSKHPSVGIHTADRHYGKHAVAVRNLHPRAHSCEHRNQHGRRPLSFATIKSFSLDRTHISVGQGCRPPRFSGG